MAHQKALRSECKLVLKASVTVWLVSTVRTGVSSQVEHGNEEGEDARISIQPVRTDPLYLSKDNQRRN